MFGWKSSPCSSSAYSLYSSLTFRNQNLFVPPPEISSPELTRSSKQCEEEGDIEFNEKLTHLKCNITPRIGLNTDFISAGLVCDEEEKYVVSEHDVPIHAGQFSAQTNVVTGNDQKFTTSELKIEGEKEMLICNQYKKTPARTTSKQNQKSNMTLLVELLVVVLFFMLPRSGAVVVTFPSQPMPDACKAHFDAVLTCPKPGIDNYDNLSQICCTGNETKLHCLSSGHEVKICCLVPITVDKGMFIDIHDSGGSPNMTNHTCEKEYYEPDDRQSNQIFHSYCTNPKSVCNPNKGQQLRCHGGTTQDDLCQCRQGYEPDPRPFDPDGYCREAPCTNGTERSLSYDSDSATCTPDMKALNYTCQKLNPKVINDKDESANLAYLGLLALVLIPAVGVFIGLYKTNRNFRNWVQRCKKPQAESNGPQTAFPLMDLPNQGQRQNGTPSHG